MCQISVQPPVNGELVLRFQQLQSRLATLKIENEEVRSRTLGDGRSASLDVSLASAKQTDIITGGLEIGRASCRERV